MYVTARGVVCLPAFRNVISVYIEDEVHHLPTWEEIKKFYEQKLKKLEPSYTYVVVEPSYTYVVVARYRDDDYEYTRIPSPRKPRQPTPAEHEQLPAATVFARCASWSSALRAFAQR